MLLDRKAYNNLQVLWYCYAVGKLCFVFSIANGGMSACIFGVVFNDGSFELEEESAHSVV